MGGLLPQASKKGNKWMEEIKIKYFDKTISKIEKISVGDWIDLRAAKTMHFLPGDCCMIPLGVGMMLPAGYEAHVVPRSSTFKRLGLIQGNSFGVIDNSYCGDNDQWYFPAWATEKCTVEKNERICQFRIMKKQPELKFVEVEHLKEESRGGFGSTGRI